MGLEKISHIGIAVRSIDSALRFYRDLLGLPVQRIEEIPSEHVRVAILPLGESRLELLEPTSPDSPVARFMERRGEGIHHLAVGVSDIEGVVGRLRTVGAIFAGKTPRPGSGGSRVAFLHPKESHGVLVEFCEESGVK